MGITLLFCCNSAIIMVAERNAEFDCEDVTHVSNDGMNEEGDDVNQASSLRMSSLLHLFGDVKEK